MRSWLLLQILKLTDASAQIGFKGCRICAQDLASADSQSKALKSPETTETSSTIPPVPCRDDFAAVAEDLFRKTGAAAEIGVNKGVFARQNLQKWSGRYYMVDAWGYFPRHNLKKLGYFQPEGPYYMKRKYMNETMDRVLAFGDRARVVRGLSVVVASSFRDEALDWIFIDAGHKYEEILADLEAWYPKVRRGGLLSGDDYVEAGDTPYLPMDRLVAWHRQVRGPKFMPHKGWGVISAVQEFTAK
eukprot:CAMPEP_0197692210 /NCGR_PEP_ID=MMETSP1338-20131121/110767_1 /TAXON_ID=43686 ORGANISM="Pelagodinium beii, Strain RCC1491" /NCGR_SAMPLE_ID=MMETSP1338 /ASSEMBLY_ACC=CAM_ASM_000754 /LENGTH=244 /DNA_ID=CAMNT_0043274841 /DNA_START=44 /DNA_END=775 /DNA_ORIENTATION=+